MGILALKLTLTPGVIAGATLAARRFGPTIGGWLIGRPVTAGPVLLVLALEHGARFADRVAVGLVAGVAAQAAFVLGYAWACRRGGGWRAALATATASFAATGALLVLPHPRFGTVAACSLALLAVGLLLLPPDAVRLSPARPRHDLPLRIALATSLLLLITTFATTLGAGLSGVVTVYPLLSTLLAVFAHRSDGPRAALAAVGASRFAQLLRDLGVHPDTQIVAYDAGNDGFAARFWFLARYVGHDAVAVLDGGFAAWAGTGKRVTTEEPKRSGSGTLQAKPRPHTTVDANDVAAALEKKHFTLVDARGADRFAGQNETIDPVAGHIPGALNRPFRSNFSGPFGTYKAPQQLRAEFEALGVDPQQVVHQCGSGVTAAANLLAMEIAGLHGARLYPGSWSEWCADPSRPVTRSA